MEKKLIAVLAAALLASCANYSEPYSLVGAQKWNMTNPNTFNISLNQIDGSSPLNQPAKITPGKHTLTVNLGNSNTNVTMDFKPCTQYWIGLQAAGGEVNDADGASAKCWKRRDC